MLLEEAKKRADSFSSGYQSLKVLLYDMDGKLRGTKLVHSSSGVLKQQLEDHKVG